MKASIYAAVTSKPPTSLTENGLYILSERYLRKNAGGQTIETPEDMFHRVAGAVSSAERNYGTNADVEFWTKTFFRVMTNLEFLPNSPALLNAGRETGQLCASFVLPVTDDAAFGTTSEEAVTVHRSGGGTGFSLSELRPNSTEAVLKNISAATDSVKQGGIRRGCNIAVLDVRHPDIIQFISAKDHPEALTNFYLSVAVTDQFMQAVASDGPHELILPFSRKVAARVKAKTVFDSIVEQTWKTGDPGLIFSSRVKDDNPTPELGEINGVCGCGEQMLLPYESCVLGSINLAKMVRFDGETARIDFDRLGELVKIAIRFLDDVIDVNKFPLPRIAETTRRTRKIGLGVMGFADMLIQLGIPYDSVEAAETGGSVMGFIKRQAHEASVELGAERGPFPAHTSRSGPRRNASCTAIAPTGTISLIAGCSSGIEPIFAPVFARGIEGGRVLMDINFHFKEALQKSGCSGQLLIKKLAAGRRLSEFDDLPEPVARLFRTATEIDPKWHVMIQAAFQKYTDGGVSKTVNLPQTATRTDVANVYLSAYAQGIKGITAYRDGSRKAQPLFTGPEVGKMIERDAIEKKLLNILEASLV